MHDRMAGSRVKSPPPPPPPPPPRRLRNSLAALIALLLFLAAPAQAYKAGTGAEDAPDSIPAFADVAAYLAGAERRGLWVRIGSHDVAPVHIEDWIRSGVTVTDANLIATYADAAAYLADSQRTSRLYAKIDGRLYLVSELEAANNQAALTDSNLPRHFAPAANNAAVGDDARATGRGATAVGSRARASEDASAAFGRSAVALGDDATALGASSTALSTDSTALGQYTFAQGEWAVAAGVNTAARGWSSTAVGALARAAGSRNTAVGGSAQTASSIPVQGLGRLIECAHLPEGIASPSSFASRCDSYLTAGERANANLAADSAAGRAFRQTVRQRLATVLNALSVTRATAVGQSARATADRATALGQSALASAEYATAVGQYSGALGERSVALGAVALAGGARSTALGSAAAATGRSSVSVGRYAQAHGDHALALGPGAGAGAWVAAGRYADAAAWLADAARASSLGYRYAVIAGKVYAIADLAAVASLTDANLPTPVAESAANVINPTRYYRDVAAYLADSGRAGRHQVAIGGKVYAVAALEAVSNLDETNLPAALTGAAGAIAVGAGAQAPAERAIAIGRDARAVGANAIAIGAGVSAGANEVVIGGSGHRYRLPGAAAQTENPELLTVDRAGRLTADGGALHGRVGALGTGLGTAADGPKEDGSAFERIADLKETVDLAEERLDETLLGARTRTLQVEVGDDGTLEGDRMDVMNVQGIYAEPAKRSGTVRVTTDGGDRVAVTFEGIPLNRQIVTMLAMLTDTRLSTTPVMGEDGEPVGTTMNEFLALDGEKAARETADPELSPEQRIASAISSKERLAYLFQALYGRPYGGAGGGVADPATDSDTPHADSIAGRLGKVERGELPAPYEKGDPARTEGYRIVVEERLPDNTAKLRTLAPGQLFDFDRRVDALGRQVGKLGARLDRATAMTSALTALPNVVPAGGRFYLGAGVGHYNGRQALAIGFSARVGREGDVHLNAGMAGAGADSYSGRLGAGIVF